jgi:hypothetical protein
MRGRREEEEEEEVGGDKERGWLRVVERVG